MTPALAIVHFPVRPGALAEADRLELGLALQERGRAVARGEHAATGTIVVPYGRTNTMRVELDIRGPKKPGTKRANGEFADWTMNYYELGDEYTDEVANVAKSYASLISTTPGTATEDPKYTVTFKATPDRGAAITAAMRDLKFSEMKKLEDAGLALLVQLNQGAEREIRAGQRT